MPSVTTWNRLEPRSRSLDLKAGLEARVHDPLWMLGRQWQVGEFEGRDAGSPVLASVQFTTSPLDRFTVGSSAAQAYDIRKPIEAVIEQEKVRPTVASGDYRQACEAGLYFLRLLNAAQLPATIASLYLQHYPLTITSGKAQTISSIAAGRVIDGIKLHVDLVAAGANLPSQPVIPAAQHDAVLKVTRDWLTWYGALFSEPQQAVAWSGDRMEYSFAVSAGDADSYVAKEYDGGAVDWYTFDHLTKPGTTQPKPTPIQVAATPVTFRGMPARRFWEMEDAGTNIAQLSAAAEDLGRILLREFALVFGNDWFQFPIKAPVGSQVQMTSLSVADTFGIVTSIPHYSVVDGMSGRWRMFDLSRDSDSMTSVQTATHPILLMPGVVSPLDSAAIEEALLLRDEVANMAWGIERMVSASSGQPLDRTTAWNTSLPATLAPAQGALPQYRLGSDVPNYWLPFLPVQTGNVLKLLPGKMPGGARVALGRMLADASSGFFIEEIPREGVLLQRRYRIARGLDGSTYLWAGRKRSVGKGEGRSGLKFDFLD